MNITTDCDGTFLGNCQLSRRWIGVSHIPPVVRLTLPEVPRGPKAPNNQYQSSCEMLRLIVAYLVAQPLYIALRQLFALHQALDPAVQRGDRGGLGRRSRRELHGLRHLDVLHVRIHICGASGVVVVGGGRLLWRSSCRGVLALSNLADDVPPAGK